MSANKQNIDVFLLRGFVRSGTNWLGRILNLHPDINCQGEFHLYPFKHFQSTFEKQFKQGSCIYQNNKQSILNSELNRFFRAVIRRYCERDKYQLVGNRTPAGLADLWIPNCKHIVITRDGRSVVASWFFHTLKHKTAELYEFPKLIEHLKKYEKDRTYFDRFPEELLDCEGFLKRIAKRWNDRVVNDHRLCQLSNEGRIPLDYYWVNYSNLHEEPEFYRNEIYKYLGANPSKALPFDDTTLPAYNKSKVELENQNKRARGAINSWQKYFTEKHERWFNEVAQQGLIIHNSTYKETNQPIN